MKKMTIGLIAIMIFGMLLLSGCTKTSVKEFEQKCENSGGKFTPTESGPEGYHICACLEGQEGYYAYPLYYKDVKNNEWSGC